VAHGIPGRREERRALLGCGCGVGGVLATVRRVSAGARASPCWCGGQRRPARIHSLVVVGVELMGGVKEVAACSRISREVARGILGWRGVAHRFFLTGTLQVRVENVADVCGHGR
jgi:hypothetical protein